MDAIKALIDVASFPMPSSQPST